MERYTALKEFGSSKYFEQSQYFPFTSKLGAHALALQNKDALESLHTRLLSHPNPSVVATPFGLLLGLAEQA